MRTTLPLRGATASTAYKQPQNNIDIDRTLYRATSPYG
jgi:hypothetical protein